MMLQVPAEDLQALHEEWALSRVIRLPDHAVVVIAGAYKGKLMEYMTLYHSCKAIYGFEPQPWAYDAAVQRMGAYPNCHVLPYGIALAPADNISMGEWGTDACSMLTQERDTGYGNFREVLSEFTAIINREERPIDLAILNMEGYEFLLLEGLLAQEHIASMVRRFAVQFHLPYASPSSYGAILYGLDKRYRHSFNYFLGSWGLWGDQAL